MPIPGGVLALQQSLSFYPAVQRTQRRGSSFVPDRSSPADDPELLAYNETSRYFKENLKCSMMFFKEIIPSSLDTVHGVLVLEAKQEIVHSGMFILMKGLTLPPKKRHVRRVEGNGKKQVTSLKYVVLGYTANENGECDIVIEEGSRESYPLELELPSSVDDLPMPMITGEGKLMYRLQLYMTTSEGRHVQIGETKLQFQGCSSLSENSEEVEKPWRLPLQVQSKRSILALGRKKTVNLEVSMESSGYLPQENMEITMVANTQDKATRVECRVELIQKVWYQVTVPGGRRVSVRMKINVVTATKIVNFEVDQGKEVVLQEGLQVPQGLTPTYKYDFMNSVNYILRVTAGIAGDKDGKVVGEAPVIIGTSRDDRVGNEEGGLKVREEEDGASAGSWSYDTSPCRSGAETPQMRASQSLTFIPFRERSNSLGSVRSNQSQASSTATIFRLPPSYSQLSSRRPTLETLPPAYCELELQEKCMLLQHDEEEHEQENSVDQEDDEQNAESTRDEGEVE